MADPHIHIPAVEMPSLDPADRPLVIVHNHCPDGWCCEFLFRRHFGDNADYMQASYGDPIPDVRLRPHVYIADFSWPEWEMRSMQGQCRGRMTVIDHHKSAKEVLVDTIQYQDEMSPPSAIQPIRVVFDLNHSGAYLTWQFLKDAGATDPVFADGNPPLIVQLVQDRDLWKWELPDSRELNAAMSSYPKTVEAWIELHSLLTPVSGGGYWRLVREGAAILRRQEQEVEAAVNRAVWMDIAGHRVLVVNTTCHHSEVGGRLAEGKAFGATYFDDLKRNLRVWSFRSAEGGIDVSEIARRWPGGGGHVRAAGCQVPLDQPVNAMSGQLPYHLETQRTLAT